MTLYSKTTLLSLALLFSIQSPAQEQKKMFEFNQEAILQAQCKMKEPLSNAELLQWTQNAHAEETVPYAKIGAATFKNEEPAWLLVYRQLVSKDDAKTRGEFVEEQNSFLNKKVQHIVELKVSDETVLKYPTKCTKVLCALKEIFGERQALQLSYLLIKHRFNGSHLRFINADPLKTDELDDMILALSDLPSFMTPVQYDEQMIKFKRGYMRADPDSENVIADTFRNDNGVSLFDLWTDQDHMSRHWTIIHEFGHVMATAMDMADYEKSWTSLSHWKQTNNEYKSLNKNEFVTEYATSSPAEDFAESFAAYRYAPQELRRVSPRKYEYMRSHVFRGIEYRQEKDCSSKLYSSEINNVLRKVTLETEITSAFIKNAVLICSADKSGIPCLEQLYLDMLNKQRVEAIKKINNVDPIEKRRLVMATEPTLTEEVTHSLLNNYTSAIAEKLAENYTTTVGQWNRYDNAIYGNVCKAISETSHSIFANGKTRMTNSEYDKLLSQTDATSVLCKAQFPNGIDHKISLNTTEIRDQIQDIILRKMH